MKLQIKKHELYILIYFAAFLIHYFTNLNFYITYFAWIIIGLYGLYWLYYKNYNLKNIIRKLLIIDLFATIGILLNQNHSPFNVLILPVSQMFGIYMYMYRNELKNLDRLIKLFWIYIVIYALVVPKTVANASQGLYYTRFSNLVGGNTISIFLIFFLAIDSIYRHYSRIKPHYIFFIVSLIIAFWCGGTGGVLSITVFLFGIICIKWKKNGISKFKLFSLLGIGLAIIFGLGYQYMVFNYVTDDNARFWIWSRYWECSTNSIKDFIFGASIENVHFLVKQRNMHNTFINFHYYYGMLPFLYYLFTLIWSIYKSLQKRDFVLLLIIAVTFLRGMTDEAAFCFVPIWTFATLSLSGNYKDDI